jgi:peptidyl-prolyl cis-trans isomerase SurA
VLTDSRGETIRKAFTDRLRQEYEISENPDAWSEMLELADSTLLEGKWRLPETFSAAVENPVLLTIEKVAATSKDFLEYTKSRLKPRPKGADPKVVLRTYYNGFLDKRLLEYERDNLEKKYPEFKALIKDIREGVLLSQVMEEQVWQRSLDDSLGQVRLYQQNIAQYNYPTRALATVVEAKDTATLNQMMRTLAEPPYPLRLKGEEILFENNKTRLSAAQLNSLYVLAATLKKNADFVVEVAGARTAEEADTMSAARISQVVRYLNGQGIPITRIMEKDYGSFRPVPVPEATTNRNRRVSFQYFSRSRKDLERAMNLEAPGSVKISGGFFARDHPYFKNMNWQVGKQTVELPGGKVALVEVEKIEESRPKPLPRRGERLSTPTSEFWKSNGWIR